MRLRTQIAILAGGMFLIPIVVTAGVYFMMSMAGAARDAADGPLAAFRWVRDELPRLMKTDNLNTIQDKIPPPIRLAIFGAEDQVIFSTISRFPSGSTPGVNDLFGYSSRNGNRSHVIWYSMQGGDRKEHVVMIEMPRNFHPDLRRRETLPGVIMLSCLFIFAALTSASIIRTLTRSVSRLEHATERIAGGDLDFELSARGNSEIASLTRSFDKMRRTLKDEYARRARFIMGVSHDLRTPLSLIEGYAEAISDGLASDPEQHRKYISVIREKAHLLETMVNQIIDFAKLETAEWKRSLTSVNLYQFLNDIGAQYEQDALILNRHFSFELNISKTLEVVMDPTLTVRAFENLIGNALRYTQAGGSIHLTAYQEGDTAFVAIRDTGPGIPEDDVPYVFEPFYRGSNSRREEGTGLGLAVVKSVIESHGWSITVRSGVNVGTTFVVSIPLSRPSAETTVENDQVE